MSKELRTWKRKATLALFLGVLTFILVFGLLFVAIGDPKAAGSVFSLGTGGGIGLYFIWRLYFNWPKGRKIAPQQSVDRSLAGLRQV